MKENLYLVDNGRGRSLYILATSGTQAKRIYCQKNGIRPSDEWCGISSLTARKLKPEEVRAWEEKGKGVRETLLFIQRMMDIAKEAHKEA